VRTLSFLFCAAVLGACNKGPATGEPSGPVGAAPSGPIATGRADTNNSVTGGEAVAVQAGTLPPPGPVPRFVGRWAADQKSCASAAWQFTQTTLRTPSGSSCSFGQVTEVPGGYDVYGPRVPAVVMSAYSKPHAVTNVVHDHTSLLATIEAKWNLPPGWKVGEIQWPIPLKLTEPGDIQIYGYHDEVLLMQEITPPTSISDSSVTLAADANWLVCEKICIPGNASVQVALPVSTAGSPASYAESTESGLSLPEAVSPSPGSSFSCAARHSSPAH